MRYLTVSSFLTHTRAVSAHVALWNVQIRLVLAELWPPEGLVLSAVLGDADRGAGVQMERVLGVMWDD